MFSNVGHEARTQGRVKLHRFEFGVMRAEVEVYCAINNILYDLTDTIGLEFRTRIKLFF